ncbi:MAG TPA: hypothetical protein VNT26_22590 [Candidatus Sulfotelmatobacter sp.]|nr:hypothetical protein [Candidatus Sulfotelmatobacter sp.]HWI55778.1 hypothetical protein [Bacillota bacterium]
MQNKWLKVRSPRLRGGPKTGRELNLEFEGKRAFVIWDWVTAGKYLFKARVEINPKHLRKACEPSCDYVYRGKLVLPRPENN